MCTVHYRHQCPDSVCSGVADQFAAGTLVHFGPGRFDHHAPVYAYPCPEILQAQMELQIGRIGGNRL